MKRRSVLMLVGLLVAVGNPAVSQSQPKKVTRIKKKPVQLKVDDFYPKTGKAGTKVTILGKGFGNRTQVLFGGRPVRPSQVESTKLEFTVPARYRDGSIVLRHPGVARDVVVGNFAIVESARITGFAPRSGVAGTRVEIRGSGFRRGDKVMLGGVELKVQRLAPKRIVAVVPPGATSGYLSLVGANGSQARSRDQFEVRSPAPVITRLEPPSGLPGARVRVWGQNFSPRDNVYYGRRPVDVAGRGNGWIDVTIPARARVGNWLVVRGPNGEARSPQRFQLERAPVVNRIAPTYGRAGQRVSIYGRNFAPGDRVKLGGSWLEVVQIRANQISVVIPARATSGPLVVHRGGLAVASPQIFDVLYAPAITDFSPKAARAGSRVALKGQYFDSDVRVYYGRTPLPIRSRTGDHTLVVDLPKGDKQSRKFRVRTRAGEAISAQPFQVQVYAVITNVQPRQGYAGTRVTISGRDFSHAEVIMLDNDPLTIVSRNNFRAVVDIPPGASSGVVSVRSYGQVQRSKFRFTVLAAPEITAYSPQVARPGMELTIDGRNFSPRTTVHYGKRPLRVVRRGADQLIVQLPRGLKPGRDHLWVRNGRSEYRSPQQFQVLPSAYVNDIRPERVEADSKVIVRGDHFDSSCRVFWGNLELPVVRLDRSGKILEVQVPEKVVGARWVFVDDGGARHRSRSKLEVYSPPRNKPGRVIDHRDKGKGKGGKVIDHRKKKKGGY